MIKKFILSFLVLGIILSSISFSADIPSDLFSKFVNIKGKYLGQQPPGLIPKLFAPFLLDYKKHHMHSAPAFSPAGNEIYFSAYVKNELPQRIFYTKMSVDGIWSKPEVVSFSGEYQEGGPIMSPDGKRIYFYSKRPFKDGEKVRKKSLIFYAERKKEGGWSKAIRLIVPEGLGLGNYPSHFGKDGCLYIEVKMARKNYKMFKAYIKDNRVTSVVKMDKPVTFDPKEEYLIHKKINWNTYVSHFEIAFKKKDGLWTKSQLMGDTINSKQTSSRFPSFSPDGKYFFFPVRDREMKKYIGLVKIILKYVKNII